MRYKALMVLVLAVLIGRTAFAQEEPLKLTMEGSLVTHEDVNGKQIEKLIELPKEVNNGDTIAYSVGGSNVSDRTLVNIGVVGAVPSGTKLVEGSVTGPVEGKVLYSVDGGNVYAPWPISEEVTRPDGTVVEREVSIDRYTNVKFVVPELEAGKSFTYSYRVTVK